MLLLADDYLYHCCVAAVVQKQGEEVMSFQKLAQDAGGVNSLNILATYNKVCSFFIHH
jgi:hypothetical protein